MDIGTELKQFQEHSAINDLLQFQQSKTLRSSINKLHQMLYSEVL
jgi:hypothetical protein